MSLAFVAVMIVNSVSAQELVSKKGFKILPEAGDYSLGFNAIPLVDLALNFSKIMDNTGQTAQHLGYVNGFNQVIVGKYFMTETMAIRGKVGINTARTSATTYFDDPKDVFTTPADPTKWGEIKDVHVTSTTDIILCGGVEYRRGHNRLQGFYGGEALLGFKMISAKNTWGVEMNQEAITNGYTNGDGSVLSGRVLSTSAGTAITFGVRGFAGVEYFFAPKMSIAGEFGWGLGLKTTPRGKTVNENWTAANVVEEKETKGTAKGSGFGFQVDNGFGQNLLPSAALTVNFHF